MKDTYFAPEYKDHSSRYFEEVSQVSDFSSSESYHAIRLLLLCISEHHIMMSIRSIRDKYVELLENGLKSNMNLTELTKGLVIVNSDGFNFRPVQSVSKQSTPGVCLGPKMTKSDIRDLLSINSLSYEIDDSYSLEFSTSFPKDVSCNIKSLIPSEELRASLYSYFKAQNMSSYYDSRIQRIHRLSDDCIQQLTHRNLRLVMSVVKKEFGHLNDFDAIQEGNIGLLKGISRYQPLTGFMLTTYCTWWINKYVKQSKYNHQLIKTPFNVREAYCKVQRFLRANPHITASDSNVNVIADKTGLSVAQIKDVLSDSRSVVYVEELERIECSVDDSGGLNEFDEKMELLMSKLPNKEKEQFCDLLTLSPSERSKRMTPHAKKVLLSAIGELDLAE